MPDAITEKFDTPMQLETNLPEDKVADLKQPAEPAATEKVEEAPAKPEAEEPKVEPEKVEPEEPKEPKKPKAKPIADLLQKKHELESELESERKARQELEAKIQQLSTQPKGQETDADIKAIAEQYGLDEAILQGIVNVAQKGLKLPKEVTTYWPSGRPRRKPRLNRKPLKPV